MDGRRGLRKTWVPALACGIAFAVAQFAASDYGSAQLADIGTALAGAAALVAVPHTRVAAPEAVRASVLTGTRSEELDERDPNPEILRAYAPYPLIVMIFSVAQIPTIKDWLAQATRTYDWPFRNVVNVDGEPAGGARGAQGTSVLALAHVMNLSGQAATIGHFVAAAALGRRPRQDDLVAEPHHRLHSGRRTGPGSLW